MKNYLLFTSCLFFSAVVSAQAPVSDDQLRAAASAESRNASDIEAFVQYYHTKQDQQPSQRNIQNPSVQTMSNPGFETGNFWGWSGYIGDNTISSNGSLQNIQTGIFSTIPDAPLTNSAARHTIITSAFGNDPYGGFPTLPAGMGNYTARLGGTTANYQGEILEQNFPVDAGTPYIKISYAVVLQSGGHVPSQSAYFTYILLDSLGDTIARRFDNSASTTYTIYAGDTAIKFLPWTTDSVSLALYIGQNITLRYTVAGCTQSGHWGYCYVDADYPYLNSIEENSSFGFSIYPNPANENFGVNLSHRPGENESVFLTNLLGQKTEVAFSQNETGWRVNTFALKPGVYFVHVRSGNLITTQKVIIQ